MLFALFLILLVLALVGVVKLSAFFLILVVALLIALAFAGRAGV